MASVKQNILKIEGKLGGLSFYKINGKNVVRKSYGPTAEIINTNPNYSNVKKNNKEFSGATQLSKLIRKGLGSTGKKFQDTYMASRLTGVCRNIISSGNGNFGERDANLKVNPNKLINFPLIKDTDFNSICKAKYEVQTAENSKQINCYIPSINKSDFLKIPKYVTHFKLTMLIVCVSPYKYDALQDKYLPESNQNNGTTIITNTDFLSIKQAHNGVNLSIDKSNIKPTSFNTAATVWLGINMYYISNQEVEPLPNRKAMQCIAVL